MKLLLIIALSLLISLETYADGKGIELKLESSSSVSAGLVMVEFQLSDTHQNRILTPDDLVLSHERILHLLVYDRSLTQFQHVHPTYENGRWRVELNFSVNGNYFLWAQGVTAGEFVEFSSMSKMQVINGSEELSAPTSLPEVRVGEDRGSVATMSDVVLKVGSKLGPSLKFSRADGSLPEISPYLGAFAHVIAVSINGESLVHVHPQSGQAPDEGEVHFRFEKSGEYRVWVQFIDGGILRTVAMAVTAY